MEDLSKFGEDLANQKWRLNNLYKIRDKDGNIIPFRMNGPQTHFYENFRNRNLVLKARQLGFCGDPSTRVLTADHRWITLEDLNVGDRIVSTDEMPPGGRGAGRKLREAVVESKWSVFEVAYRLTMSDGSTLMATGPHRFLMRVRKGTEMVWRTVEDARPGDEIRFITSPWNADAGYEDGWFSGIIDGEGCLRAKDGGGCELSISQVDGSVLNRARGYLDRIGIRYREEIDRRPPGASSKLGKKIVHKLVVSRIEDIFTIIGRCRPSRFVDLPWWAGKDLPGKRIGNATRTIRSIECIGERRMIDLQTSTKTFVFEGFVSHNSTEIDLIGLDSCLFIPNFKAAVIAHKREAAQELLKNNVQTPYMNLPGQLLEYFRKLETTDSRTEYSWSNGSSIRVDTSTRSASLNLLHVSEFGKICAKRPDVAKEIVTGAIEAVPRDGLVVIESTAEGQEGYFYDWCADAVKRQQQRKIPTALDYVLFFYPWFDDPAYVEFDDAYPISPQEHRYFDQLERDLTIEITHPQRVWYLKKRESLQEDMMREYPSTWEEAFRASIEGAYFTMAMAMLRKRGGICRVPHQPGVLVDTFWDLGMDDYTAIWFYQQVGPERRFLKYIEDRGEGAQAYVRLLREISETEGYEYGAHYFPHDARQKTFGQPKSTEAQMMEMGVDNIIVVDSPPDSIGPQIQAARSLIPTCFFDEEKCKLGLTRLAQFRKEWDDKLGVFREKYRHDLASHGATAFLKYAWGYQPNMSRRPNRQKKRRGARNWKVV